MDNDGHGRASPIMQEDGEEKKKTKKSDLHLLSLQTNLFGFTAAKHLHLSFTDFALEQWG